MLLGTLYPLAMDALRLGKISVGPPYFEAVLAPVFLLLLALLIPAAWLRWGAVLDAATARMFKWLGAGFVVALLAAWGLLHGLYGSARPAVVLTLALACVVGAATKLWAWRQLRKGGLTAPQWGMVIAHLGVAVFAIGVAMVSGYGVERDVRLVPGNSKASVADATSQLHQIADCQLTFDRIDPARGPNYMALAGHFTLACAGDSPVALKAEKRNYVGSSMPMTESAIRWGLTRDLYVALGEPLEGTPFGAWSVRVQYKPFMRWVWIGVVLMALGAGVAAGSRRYRKKQPIPGVQPAPSAIENTAFEVRHEHAGDAAAIDAVTQAAFAHAPHSQQTEHHIVRALRAADAMPVSLVAVDAGGAVIGHVAASPVRLADGRAGWFGIGPLSVAPEQQRRGVGQRLMHALLEQLQAQGAAGCVLLGDPVYYARFGFAPQQGLEMDGLPAEHAAYFQALAFGAERPRGVVRYHPAFGAAGAAA